MYIYMCVCLCRTPSDDKFPRKTKGDLRLDEQEERQQREDEGGGGGGGGGGQRTSVCVCQGGVVLRNGVELIEELAVNS